MTFVDDELAVNDDEPVNDELQAVNGDESAVDNNDEPQAEKMLEVDLGSPEPESDLSDVESEIETVLLEENLKGLN